MNLNAKKKSGAALILVLGFLAILTVVILTFSGRTRSARQSGRAYLNEFRSRQLLETAKSRAMLAIENAAGTTRYPDFFAISSVDGSDSPLGEQIRFTVEQDLLPLGNERIREAYEDALQSARWQTATAADGTAIGRYGFVAVNLSGLLDINEAGGLKDDTHYMPRSAGRSPHELQLARDNRIADEFNAQTATTAFPLVNQTGPAGTVPNSVSPEMAPAFALVYNRDRAWNRFETLRDVLLLGNLASPNVFTESPASLSTFSFDPSDDVRSFMGTNSASLNESVVGAELKKISAVPDVDFVLNQLRDYLDTDVEPQDITGAYTDYSVEPTPLLNELVLECSFTFEPNYGEAPEGGEEEGAELTSVIISNSYSLLLECWHPFTGRVSGDQFGVAILEDPIAADLEQTFEPDLLGDISLWETDGVELLSRASRDRPEVITMASGITTNEVTSAQDIETLFEEMLVDITFPMIICSNLTAGHLVDRVEYLDLQLGLIGEETLLSPIEDIGALFSDTDGESAEINLVFTAGMAAVDPRLNWDGRVSKGQWVEVSDSTNSYLESLGAINRDIINAKADADDPLDRAFVRNEDRIDTPYELTYFLYDPTRAWQTFQFLEVFDEDDTRRVLKNLSCFADGPPRAGRINPYSPHRNVIATLFMNLPLDEFNQPARRRMNAEQADAAAALFMDYIEENSWPGSAASFGDGINTQRLREIMDVDNPWELEAFFRNTYELFNPRDTQFMLLLAAQDGTDRDEDGRISDTEAGSTQTAALHVWRDPETGKAAPVFYGLGETMQHSLLGPSWKDILEQFAP